MPSPRRATIADVAAASGVGVGTVSRVINGAANVRETTRVSVQKVIDQLGYRPSHLAASLSRGTARTMAIVVPHLTRPSVVMRLAGALAVLDEQGYDTVVCNVDTPQQRDHHLAALTKRHRADGVIVVSLRLSRQQLASFQRTGVPLVTVGVLAPGVPQTVTDDVTGGRLATEHLLSLGHRRIGFVGDTARRMSATNLGFSASQHRLTRIPPGAGGGRRRLRPRAGAARPVRSRRTPRRWRPSCWRCRTGRRPSSRRQTPRRWVCSPRRTGAAFRFPASCR